MFIIFDTVTDTAVIAPISNRDLAQEGADYANRLRKSDRFIVKQVS